MLLTNLIFWPDAPGMLISIEEFFVVPPSSFIAASYRFDCCKQLTVKRGSKDILRIPVTVASVHAAVV